MPSLEELFGGGKDRPRATIEGLTSAYAVLLKDAENGSNPFNPGDLVTWKNEEVQDKRWPEVGEPALVTKTFERRDVQGDAGRPRSYGDMICLTRTPCGDYEEYYFDSNRMVPYVATETATESAPEEVPADASEA